MPFYKVPAVTSNNSGPRRIRAPLRHSVNSGGGTDTATTSRDCDVISSDGIASAGESKRQTSYSDQVDLSPIFQQGRLSVECRSTSLQCIFIETIKYISVIHFNLRAIASLTDGARVTTQPAKASVQICILL